MKSPISALVGIIAAGLLCVSCTDSRIGSAESYPQVVANPFPAVPACAPVPKAVEIPKADPRAALPEAELMRIDHWLDRLIAAAENPSTFERTRVLYAIVSDMPLADIPPVLDVLYADSSGSIRSRISNVLVGRWLEVAPADVLQWSFRHQSSSSSYPLYFRKIFSGWGEADPVAAAHAAILLQNLDQRAYALQAVGQTVAGQDHWLGYQFALRYADYMGSRDISDSVFRQWGQAAPEEALRHALEIPRYEKRRDAVRAVVREWRKRDPMAALSAVLAMEPSGMRRPMINEIIYELARRSPHKAFEVYSGLPAGTANEWTLVQLYKSWGEVNPQGALEHLLDSGFAFSVRTDAARAILLDWYRSDPPAALAFIEQMQPGRVKNKMIGDLIHNQLYDNLALCFTLLGQLPKGEQYDHSFHWIISRLATQSPQDAIDYVMKHTSGVKRLDAVEVLISKISEENPRAAVELLALLPPGNGRSRSLDSILSDWLQSDPEGALAWVQSIENFHERENALRMYNERRARVNPVTAANAALTQVDPQQRRYAVSAIVDEWAKEHPAAALDWCAAIEDEALRQSAVKSAVLRWAKEEPVPAADWVIANILFAIERNALLGDLVGRWTESDIDAAVLWVGTQSARSGFPELEKRLLRQWAYADSRSASDYIAQMPVGENRNLGAAYLVEQLLRSDPAAAAQSALLIDDVRWRRDLLQQCLSEWVKSDKPAVRQFIVSTKQLSEETREQLLGTYQ